MSKRRKQTSLYESIPERFRGAFSAMSDYMIKQVSDQVEYKDMTKHIMFHDGPVWNQNLELWTIEVSPLYTPRVDDLILMSPGRGGREWEAARVAEILESPGAERELYNVSVSFTGAGS